MKSQKIGDKFSAQNFSIGASSPFHQILVIQSKFYWLCMKIRAKTVLPKNIQNFHLAPFPR